MVGLPSHASGFGVVFLFADEDLAWMTARAVYRTRSSCVGVLGGRKGFVGAVVAGRWEFEGVVGCCSYGGVDDNTTLRVAAGEVVNREVAHVGRCGVVV
ncbi:hypothetical protein QX201_004522 [Fusarium graminearum]